MSEKMRWYVVHVYSGSEKKVAELIEEQAEKKGIRSQIGQILIPTEDFIESSGSGRAGLHCSKGSFPAT